MFSRMDTHMDEQRFTYRRARRYSDRRTEIHIWTVRRGQTEIHGWTLTYGHTLTFTRTDEAYVPTDGLTFRQTETRIQTDTPPHSD